MINVMSKEHTVEFLVVLEAIYSAEVELEFIDLRMFRNKQLLRSKSMCSGDDNAGLTSIIDRVW